MNFLKRIGNSANQNMDLSKFNPNDTIMVWAKVNRKVKLKPLEFDDLLLSNVPKSEKLRFVCLSDTHGKHDGVDLPEGDVLLHTGDFTMTGRTNEIEDFNHWLGTLPYKHKIVIAGNHDKGLDKIFKKEAALDGHDALSNCTYLEDEEVTIGGYKIYGSPWTPEFGYWGFMERRESLDVIWNKIPDDTDILLTHGPPLGILDHCQSGALAGCMHLLDAIVNRVKPKFHIFGHIHESRGLLRSELSDTIFINASNCTIRYRPDNAPVVFELPIKGNIV